MTDKYDNVATNIILTILICIIALMISTNSKQSAEIEDLKKHQLNTYNAVHTLQKVCIRLIEDQETLASSTHDILENHSIGFAKMQDMLNGIRINPIYKFHKE